MLMHCAACFLTLAALIACCTEGGYWPVVGQLSVSCCGRVFVSSSWFICAVWTELCANDDANES